MTGVKETASFKFSFLGRRRSYKFLPHATAENQEKRKGLKEEEKNAVNSCGERLLLSIEERTLTFHSLSLFRPVTENDA
jgi:hypothetical protein